MDTHPGSEDPKKGDSVRGRTRNHPDACDRSDHPTDCVFLLEKPWRYRWPDEVRDEVLNRLLELNTRRSVM